MIRHQAGRSCATPGSVVRMAATVPAGVGSSDSRISISSPVPTPSAPASMRTEGAGNVVSLIVASRRWPAPRQTLPLDRLEQHVVAGHRLGVGPYPPLEPLQVHELAPAGVVVAHRQERLGPATPLILREGVEDGEVTVAVARRGPE